MGRLDDIFRCDDQSALIHHNVASDDPVNMFRGPTWVNQNWLVIEGLQRQRRWSLKRGQPRRRHRG